MIIEKEIKKVLEITKEQFEILKFFKDNKDKEFTSHQILEKAKVSSLSTVQKALKKLYGLNLIIRNQTNKKNGGYYFVYSSISTLKLHEIISTKMSKNFEKSLEELVKYNL